MLTFRLLIFWLCSAAVLMAQNLVPDPGFEAYRVPPRGHHYVAEALLHWYNPCLRPVIYPYGTPDCLYRSEENAAWFTPKEGQSVAGIIAYLRRISNFREYLAIRLTDPLVPGRRYRLSFYVTNGNMGEETFGSYAVSGLGACLSTVPIYQQTSEPIRPGTLHLIEREVIYARSWRKLERTFTADSAYTCLTIGNFLPDYELTRQTIRENDADPQAYYFIDDVSVVQEEADEPAVKSRPVVQVTPEQVRTAPAPVPVFQPVAAAVPPAAAPPAEDPKPVRRKAPEVQLADLEGRPVKVQSALVMKGEELTLKVWDSKNVDGDIISLQWNGQWILQNYVLRATAKKIRLRLQTDKPNYLILYAHNLGTSPPNTATIVIEDGYKAKEVMLNSDLEGCGAVQITHKP